MSLIESAKCTIKDSIWIKAPPGQVFPLLTTGAGLARWWPARAEADPRTGGKISLDWFDGGKLKSQFNEIQPYKHVEIDFYGEKLSFDLREDRNGTTLEIMHCCTHEWAIHIAQCWGFLKGNLKSLIETGYDLRTDSQMPPLK